MTSESPRVAIVTGASRGIGAGLVRAYRELGYAVVATARTIQPSDDPLIATVHGDIATEEQRVGHVVNITTTLVEHADVRVPSALASLTKGGLAAITRSLATEYAATGIRVNAVSPGVIRTPMHRPDEYEGLDELHPMGRIGEVSDIVRAVMYLESAPVVTGDVLHVDGGQTAGH
jgi:NAD(P)-dependent dehydrogenase (short-subunit alcohol dehydrogenase family)